MNFHDAFDIDASLDKGDGRAYVSVRSALYTMGNRTGTTVWNKIL